MEAIKPFRGGIDLKDKINLSYYYGSEADQFNFYRMPKLLITDDYFGKISSDAKILYGILLDRMSLSIKNHWIDEYNRVYIIYTVVQVMETMNCCERKAINLMAELDTIKGIGLIEKKKQGQGKPNLIYVKNFRIDKDYSHYTKIENNDLSDDCFIDEINDDNSLLRGSGTIMHDETCMNAQIKNRTKGQSRNCINEQYKSCTKGQSINTEKNRTNVSNTDYINQSYKNDVGKIDSIDLYEINLKVIKKNIGYDDLLLSLDQGERSQLNEILDTMVEFVTFKREIIKIKDVEYPYDYVKMKVLKNDYTSIGYLLDSYNRSTSYKTNPKDYIISMLFNAPSTVNNYYQSTVNHDMANIDRKQSNDRDQTQH